MSETKPVELYYWPTPNGQKVSILLEELEIPYELTFVHIGRGDQFKPEFLAISPNNRIPAILDPDGPDGLPISVFESAAILMYLADKHGRFYPSETRARVAVHEWLMWQMGGVGPMFGQNHHFRNYADEKIPYAIDRYVNETNRLYRILNERLEGRAFVAGDYSIADMALIGWIRNWDRRGVAISDYPRVEAWHDRLVARPPVAKALAIEAPVLMDLVHDADAKKVLFGQR